MEESSCVFLNDASILQKPVDEFKNRLILVKKIHLDFFIKEILDYLQDSSKNPSLMSNFLDALLKEFQNTEVIKMT